MNDRNSEFKALVNQAYDSYNEYLKKFTDDELKKEGDNYLPTQLLDFLKQKNIKNRGEQDWLNLKVRLDEIKKIKKLANPYFIGFGNPQSDVLIIGKEKAIDVLNKPKTFLNESINNTLHWKAIIDKDNDKLNGFNPRDPYSLPKYDKRKTWGFCYKLLKEIDEKNQSDNNYQSSRENLFERCFMTELNHNPSKKSGNFKGSSSDRRIFLEDPFFKTFSKIIIGARSKKNNYITVSEIKDIFNVEIKHLDKEIGDGLRIDSFQSNDGNRKVFFCKQLSQGSNWRNGNVRKFAKEIKAKY